jgi:protein-L-isoaspartate(D-aspartate) O-methyltransferase
MILSFVGMAAVLLAQEPEQVRRSRMIREQIASRGIKNSEVLRVMGEIPRHLFVPANVREQAYEDRPVPIGHGQTISQPFIVGFMTELLDVQSQHRILEIGTGSGYQAAILSKLAKEVFTIEIVPELAQSAEALFRRLGYKNIFVRSGNGYLGWPEASPFDRIILTAAPPEMPQVLIDQLKPGGRLLAPVGSSPANQQIVIVEKTKDGKVVERAVLPVRFVPMVRPPDVKPK